VSPNLIQFGVVLVHRNLAAYNLTGPISLSFGNLLNLLALNLSGNQLTGSIPPSIWNISKLNTLDLSKNSLFGNLITTNTTPCPGNLIYLNLAGNNFHGTFPSDLFLCSFSHLEQVICDNNSFNGILVMDILDNKYAIYSSNVLISILYNNISGLIPNNATYSPVL
jgi:Leucine-rich repeat (LRR) protein